MQDAHQIPDSTEVAIVGAGPAGSVFAATLAAAGKAVVVLEAGPAWTTGDLLSSQIWARRLKWGGPDVLNEGDDPLAHNFVSGWGFGGAALHHYAGWPRMLPEDFRLRSLYGKGADWPIDYETLRPFYDRVQDEVGVAGDVEREPWRTDRRPYPMPPLPVFRQAQVLARGFERLERPVGPTSAAINTIPYKGRPACIWDGWCDAGCPIGALANPLVTYLRQARDAGAGFHANTTVARVRTDRRGLATGLDYLDANGEPGHLRAEVVVLAGAAVQNPRLMLNSATGAHPDGLGNSSGLLGRYFVYHVIANLYGLFDEDMHNYQGVTLPPIGGAPGSPRDREDGPFGAYGWGIGPALKPNDLLGIAMSRPEIIGEALHDFMASASRRLGTIGALCETVPERNNRVETAAQTDRFGLPLARVVNRFSSGTRALWELARDDGYELMRAAGATDVWHAPLIATHQLGGTRMGEDPRQSVTDSYGRLHDAANVFVAGGGLFPTCGTAAPTFTLHALALRAAEHLVDSWV